jgi:hypothetical protein
VVGQQGNNVEIEHRCSFDLEEVTLRELQGSTQGTTLSTVPTAKKVFSYPNSSKSVYI